ncbi:hypothetical protein [Microbacterium testaceum]|nr:hypothetical protein [Microbacterium testaceum]
MSADTTSETTSDSKPVLTLLNAPGDETKESSRPASQCCGGGSCSL